MLHSCEANLSELRTAGFVSLRWYGQFSQLVDSLNNCLTDTDETNLGNTQA